MSDTGTEAKCANCGRKLHRQRNGDWYHNHNASVSCYPGSGSRKRADLVMVTAPAKKA